MADLRLFIAVELPEAAQRLLAAVARELRQADADVKWSRPENMHLTLKFLGDTPEEFVDEVSSSLDAAATGCPRHTATMSEIGAFPNPRRPRVVWVGLDEPTGRLAALQKAVDEATSDLVPPDPRGFTAHLTLGRVRSGRNVERLAQLMNGYRLTSPVEVPVNEIVLIRSELSRSGPTYTPLHRSPLKS
ncbi:MAG: RNA 2',3'-cyclic phosphodiesterase [Planctomycetes bacterium]|nr:RNA 2',3'-cyclic phosphodiesterase [Planctomycetota bacterium]